MSPTPRALGPGWLTSHSSPSQVICEKADKTDIPAIDKKKYLVPADLTVGQVRTPPPALPRSLAIHLAVAPPQC